MALSLGSEIVPAFWVQVRIWVIKLDLGMGIVGVQLEKIRVQDAL